VYTFHHPYKNTEVLMVMYFENMKSVSLQASKSHCGTSRLRFKVVKTFQEFKGSHGPNEWVTIEFNCRSDVERVKETVPELGGKGRR